MPHRSYNQSQYVLSAEEEEQLHEIVNRLDRTGHENGLLLNMEKNQGYETEW